MFCPNCGERNSKLQNYCRFCGLNLSDATKSLKNQIVFGDDSSRLKTFASLKRLINAVSLSLVGALIVGFVGARCGDHRLFSAQSEEGEPSADARCGAAP